RIFRPTVLEFDTRLGGILSATGRTGLGEPAALTLPGSAPVWPRTAVTQASCPFRRTASCPPEIVAKPSLGADAPSRRRRPGGGPSPTMPGLHSQSSWAIDEFPWNSE